jgi:RNA polymerase sigma factor (sigma-70 family)
VTLPPFQLLLDGHRGEVHRLCRALAGPDDADDCFQETFLAALRAYPALRSADNLRSWLLTIAHRKAMDVHRRRVRQAVPVATVPDGPPAPDEPALDDVWTGARRLPPKQREAVAIRFAADLAYADIGEVMGTSEDAARRNVHEALKTLRLELAP